MDRRTTHYKRTKKVITQWSIIWVLLICIVYMASPVRTPISPCPETGCALPTVPAVKAAEPVKSPVTVEEKIRAAFPEDPDMAVKVAFCESSLNPNAKHTNSSASGLFQIIKGTWRGYKCGDNQFDPDQNIECARKIYLRNGWGSTASWAASKPCWSK